MLNLTNEQKALFSLLRGEEVTDVSVDWNEVMREAKAQSIFLMMKQPDHLPEEIAKIWKKTHYTLFKANMREFYAISEMNRVMRSIDQPYVILKGLSSASYYPDLFQRAFGDVDFLIDPDHQDEVIKALKEAGYVQEKGVSDHHIVFTKGKQELEMHFAIPAIPAGDLGDCVRNYIQEILDDKKSIAVKGTVIDLPLAKYHGLVILLHMQRHMTRDGVGLRHLMDWCYFVDKTEKEAFWNTDLIPILKKIGLFYYAKVLTKAGTIYFNTAEPEWCKDINDEIADAVVEDILTGGNFGRKNKNRSASFLMMTEYRNDGKRHGKLYNMWHLMLNNIQLQFPVLKIYPVLYPVIILYYSLRRVFRVITGKKLPLWKSAKYANERDSIYEQLHFFEVE